MIAPPWLAIAQRDAAEGVSERPGASAHPRILQAHAGTTYHATSDEVAWCSAYVGLCLREAGYPDTQSAAARSYLRWGKEIDPPAYGCVVVLKQQARDPGIEVLEYRAHVGFLVDLPTPDEILVAAGNQSNALNVRPFRRELVLAFRWPH